MSTMSLLFLKLNLHRTYFQKNGLISAIEIKVKNKKDLNKVIKYLKKKNENSFYIKDKFQQRDFLFKILNSEKLSVFYFGVDYFTLKFHSLVF